MPQWYQLITSYVSGGYWQCCRTQYTQPEQNSKYSTNDEHVACSDMIESFLISE